MRHRSDISTTVKLVALGLVLLVGHHLWFKPSYVVPDPPSERSVNSAPFSARDDERISAGDVPVSRLVDLDQAPTSTLASIREELDRGNYDEVGRRLSVLSIKHVKSRAERRYVAALWNNLGVWQEKYGGTAHSVHAFKQAVAWDPANPLAHLNLTQAYWELRDPAMTTEFLERVVRLVPDDPFPHLAMADLLLGAGSISLAATHLEQARLRAEDDTNHRSYFLRLLAKVKAQQPVGVQRAGAELDLSSPQHVPAQPSGSARLASLASSATPTSGEAIPEHEPSQARLVPRSGPSHFTVRFDGPSDEAGWMRVRAILEYAFDELTQKFGHVPMRSIPVILHTTRQFDGDGGTPVWADSLFDSSSGTIHLPMQGALEDLAVFSRVARHQFVHALLVADHKGSGSVPQWLLEGLAMQLADDPWPSLEESVTTAGKPVPLNALQGGWEQLSGEALQNAYQEARSATTELVGRYSIYGVRQVMILLQAGRSLDEAMEQKLSASYKQFEQQWQGLRTAPDQASGRKS